VIPIGINYFFLFITFAVVTPHLQVLLTSLGYGPAWVGTLLGIYEVAAIVGSVAAGRVADATNRAGTVIQVCMLLCVASLLALVRYGAATPAAAVACMVVAGLTFKNSVPLTDAQAATILSGPHAYGQARVWGSIGYIVAALVVQAAALIRADDPVSVLRTTAVACLVYGGVLFLLPRTAVHRAAAPRPKTAPRAVLSRPFLGFLAVVFLSLLGMSAHYSFFSLFLTQRFGLRTVSGIWAIGTAVEIPMIFFSGALLARFGIRRLLAAAAFAVALRLALYAIAPSLAVVIGAQLLHVLTFGALHPASVAAVRRLLPPEQQGLGMALYSGIGTGLALLVGSVVGGAIVEAGGIHGFRTLYLVSAAPALLAGILALLSRLPRGYAESAGPAT
jgi:PPP family 3-phenylpropionic acid transporter